ncbi:hypothetical protein [Oceaniglobus trochenteri]|uniref:hypothetical protein n=1 Tax=Oceaniglobus trochenteri TaxID=2763260 RepID=UPI001CFF7C9B|nr:hypothetical protein [Oceaniglobus trochenteri]
MQNTAWRVSVAVATLGLAACQPAIPDSGAGVGFSSYEAYEQSRIDRELALQRGESVFPPGTQTDGAATATTPSAPNRPVISGEELRSAGLPVAGGADAGAGAVSPGAPVSATTPGTTIPAAPPVATTPIGTNNPGISDEQDFGAVSERQTIESDAERLARQRAAYKVVQPTAVPTRPGDDTPNIVAYALSTTNAVGQKMYSRGGFNADSKFLRACASYSSSDKAQEDFLRNGGPQKDRKGVDPDGDGFACYWDPTPFRKVAGN